MSVNNSKTQNKQFSQHVTQKLYVYTVCNVLYILVNKLYHVGFSIKRVSCIMSECPRTLP